MKTQDTNTQTILSRFKLNLINRDYNELEIDDNINQALSNNRAEFINKKSKNTYEGNFFWWLFLNDDGKHGCWVSILFIY